MLFGQFIKNIRRVYQKEYHAIYISEITAINRTPPFHSLHNILPETSLK